MKPEKNITPAKLADDHGYRVAAIDRLTEEVGQEFTERNFAPSSYQDQSGRSLRCYDLTRDAFSLLVMGFTGAKATQWKLAYISAFNRMESELRKSSGLPEEAAARLAKVEGDLQALIDLCFSQPQVPEGYVLIAAHVRKKRGTAFGRTA